jgi:hypothetical protein
MLDSASVDHPTKHTCAAPPCSYCKNLDFAQQQSAPFTPGQYVDYDCVLPLGSLLWIVFAEVLALFHCIQSMHIFLDRVLSSSQLTWAVHNLYAPRSGHACSLEAVVTEQLCPA